MTLLNKNKILLYLLIFSLGIISSFSLPPYNLFYINFFSYPALLWTLLFYSKDKIVSFNIGWVFGFGYFISNLYWITNSLTFEDIFKPLIPFALILIPLFLGLFYGFSTLFFSFFNPQKNFLSILILATAMSVFEYIRSFLFGGFPWNLIAFSFVNYLEFIQILSIIGTYAFNSLVILLFLFPTILFFNDKRKIKISIFIVSLLALFTNYFWGNLNLRQFELTEKKDLGFNIKIISPTININRYFQNENPNELILELINISKPDPSIETLFILPEGILSNIYFEDLKKFKTLFSNNFSKKHKIILGMNINEKQKIYNSLLVVNNDLNVLQKYYKNKLVPFGEFLPFEKVLSNFGFKKITQGYQSFSADNRRDLIRFNNYSFIPLICYEIIYSGEINNSEKNYDFILNISEDGWFGNSIGPYQHYSHSVFRSIEEGKPVIRSSNNGISTFINPKGQVIDKILTTDKGFIEIQSFKKSNKTIFSSNGNKIFFYFLSIYISLIFFFKIRGN
ncbi:apolipoprotein N-acyltransferase [Pelagibacterales bacterium SAG-MED34]|nr:apolipoprotein N-acyltransferase [Pelagibacterales bacterium SAG-MED34]